MGTGIDIIVQIAHTVDAFGTFGTACWGGSCSFIPKSLMVIVLYRQIGLSSDGDDDVASS